MAFGADFIPVLFDFAVGADEEGAADDAKKRPAEKLLHAAHAVSFDGREFGIAEKVEVEFVFGFEAGLGFDRVAAHAEDDRVQLIELFLCVAKLGRFDGSTGGVGFGEEEEDHAMAAEVGERDIVACVVFEAECGGFVACFQHVSPSVELGVKRVH
jgi:hypothetical protein